MATTNGGVQSSSPIMTTSATGATAMGSSSSADNIASSPVAVLSSNSATASGTAAAGTAVGSASSVFKKKKYVAFWDTEGPGVDAWIGAIPGPFQNSSNSNTDGGDDNIKNEKDGETTTTIMPNQGTYARTRLDYTIQYNTIRVQVFS